MKKLLLASAMFGAMVFAGPSSEAKAATVSVSANSHVTGTVAQPRRWRNRRPRVVTTTRITRVGRFRYRETIRTTYLPNGRTRTQVISRVRLGRW